VDAPLEFAVAQLHNGQFLATRSKGRTVREDLEDRIIRQRPDTVLIDFTGVEAMTISFADEFLGRFYAALDTAAPAILLLGLNDENIATVSICLERRDLSAAAIIDGQSVLLGAPEHLIETYRHALNLGTFSALELSNDLNVSPQNMNNRLKRLVAAGAIQRRRVTAGHGGKEFAYTVPQHIQCERAL
jgi:predicted transcriptional regulator